MADRSTRSSTRPQKPPPSRNQSLQSLPPLQQSTRVTRSRSHDISDADAREPAPSRKRRKAAHDEENVANSSAQANRVARRGARSKVLQDLPAVTEELGSIDAQLPLNEAGEVDSGGDQSTGGQGQVLQKTKSPGAFSAIAGTTARNSYSEQDLALSNSGGTLRKGAMKKAAATYPPADISATEVSAVEYPDDALLAFVGTIGGQGQLKGSAPKSAISRTSTITFNSSKHLKPATGHLMKRKAESEAAKALQRQQAQQEVESTRTHKLTAVAEKAVPEITFPGKSRDVGTQASEPYRSQSVLSLHHEGDDSWRPQEFGEDDDEDLAASEEESASHWDAKARQVLELQASRDAESNKENILKHADQPIGRVKKYFIDHQRNAERVSFESQEQAQSLSGNQHQRPLRGIDVAEGDVLEEESEKLSADEGFQQDQRQIIRRPRRDKTSSRKRSAPAPTASRRSPKEVPPAPRDDSSTDEIGSAAARHNQEQIPAPSQLENYRIAKKVAKFKSSSQIRRPQIRKAWTDEETETLIELIEEYGTSWTLLKERDQLNKLISRDQVALKDKARNMKFDFLKAGNLMPQNFENIPLNRLQTDKLRSLGIEY